MDEPSLPASPFRFKKRLQKLHRIRKKRHAMQRLKGNPRNGRLSSGDREKILKTTNRKCHICGGSIDGSWQADHALAHAAAGPHALDNFLPAHKLGNNYRWDYEAEEFQWLLKIGVWAKSNMEHGTDVLGKDMLKAFFAYDRRRDGRRKKTIEATK